MKADDTQQQSTTSRGRQKLQTFKIVGMSPEYTEGKIISPAIQTKGKTDTGVTTNVMPISTFRKLYAAMSDANGNALNEFNKDWTTLRAYGGGIMKQFGTWMIKCKWIYQKWVVPFDIVDIEGPTLLGLKTLRHMRIFNKHPWIYIEITDLHSMNLALASKQPKEGNDGQNLSECQNTVSGVPKVGVAACPTPAEKLLVPSQVNDDVVYVNVHLDFSDWWGEPDEYDIKDEWNKVDDCTDHTAVHGVETSSPEIQNHPDYIPPKTYLHKCPLIMSKEQLKTMYPECFDGFG